MAAVEATVCAMEGTVSCANRDDGRPVLAGAVADEGLATGVAATLAAGWGAAAGDFLGGVACAVFTGAFATTGVGGVAVALGETGLAAGAAVFFAAGLATGAGVALAALGAGALVAAGLGATLAEGLALAATFTGALAAALAEVLTAGLVAGLAAGFAADLAGAGLALAGWATGLLAFAAGLLTLATGFAALAGALLAMLLLAVLLAGLAAALLGAFGAGLAATLEAGFATEAAFLPDDAGAALPFADLARGVVVFLSFPDVAFTSCLLAELDCASSLVRAEVALRALGRTAAGDCSARECTGFPIGKPISCKSETIISFPTWLWCGLGASGLNQ